MTTTAKQQRESITSQYPQRNFMDRVQLTEHAIEPYGRCACAGHSYRDRRDRRSQQATGGFTLVELIVAMTISLIVIGIATTILLSGTNMAQRTTQRALEEQIIDGVFNFAQDRLLYAGTVQRRAAGDLTDAKNSDLGLLYVSENGSSATARGMLFSRDVSDPSPPLNVMGEDFYMSYNISLEAKLTSKDGNKPVVFLKLKLHHKTGQVVAERERTFSLINGEVVAEGEGSPNPIEVTNGDFLCFGVREPSPAPSNP
jgi:prepilin-type N-terminal cleavage/methylation domain-containing protein